MYFSAKITNSLLLSLNKKGSDLEELFDVTGLPREFMRDPTSWLDARKMEDWLHRLDEKSLVSENYLSKVGHCAPEIKAWGVLDSVLKMMQTPQDILTQPQRFLSYFISPAPPIAYVEKSENSVAFEIPISSDEYPYVTEYLRAALEALPTYMGKDMAQVSWQQTRVSVSWTQKQDSFFTAGDQGRNIDPEFMEQLISSLENAQKELEKTKEELCRKSDEVALLKHTLRSSATIDESAIELTHHREWLENLAKECDEPLRQVQNQFLKLSDYLTRAQQLITLLVGQNRLSPQVTRAMSRVDWEYVTREYPQLVQSGIFSIKSLRETMREDGEPNRRLQNKNHSSTQYSHESFELTSY